MLLHMWVRQRNQTGVNDLGAYVVCVCGQLRVATNTASTPVLDERIPDSQAQWQNDGLWKCPSNFGKRIQSDLVCKVCSVSTKGVCTQRKTELTTGRTELHGMDECRQTKYLLDIVHKGPLVQGLSKQNWPVQACLCDKSMIPRAGGQARIGMLLDQGTQSHGAQNFENVALSRVPHASQHASGCGCNRVQMR